MFTAAIVYIADLPTSVQGRYWPPKLVISSINGQVLSFQLSRVVVFVPVHSSVTQPPSRSIWRAGESGSHRILASSPQLWLRFGNGSICPFNSKAKPDCCFPFTAYRYIFMFCVLAPPILPSITTAWDHTYQFWSLMCFWQVMRKKKKSLRGKSLRDIAAGLAIV